MSSDTLMEIALQLNAVRLLLGDGEAEQAGRDLLKLLQERLDTTRGLDVCTEQATVSSRSGDSCCSYEAVSLGNLLITAHDSSEDPFWLRIHPADRLMSWEREVVYEQEAGE